MICCPAYNDWCRTSRKGYPNIRELFKVYCYIHKPYNEDRVSLIKVDNIREIEWKQIGTVLFLTKSLLKHKELCDKSRKIYRFF